MAKQKSRFPSYGLVRGPSHKHGGVAGVVAGEQPVELEGGEWIIPKEVVPDYLPVLKQITNEGRAIQQMDNGNTAIDALIASASMQTGLAKPKSPMYQEGGEVGFEQIADLATLYGAKQGITLNPADYTPEGGRSKEGYARKFGLPEGFTIDTLAYGSPANYSLKFLDAGGEKLGTSKSTGIYPILQDIRAAQINSRLDDKVSLENMSEYMKKQREDSELRDMFRTLIGSAERNYPKEKQKQQGGPVYQDGGQISRQLLESAKQHKIDYTPVGRRMRASVISSVPASMVGGGEGLRYYLGEATKSNPSLAAASARGRARSKMLSAPQDSIPFSMLEGYFDQAEPEAVPEKGGLSFLKGLLKQEQGGPIKQYGHGGQALPRKQQEMRNPAVYGPPIEMMGPMPTDTSAVDTTGNDLQHMLNQLMMRDVNQNINPFTGDTIDTYLDSLQLEGSKRKSLIPRSAGRKKSKHGGPVMYQEGGMVGQPQAMGPVPQGSLMGAANGDVRIRPLTPDTYITKLGEDGSSTMEIPKLSTAYLQSFGMETPLSKQQGASLHQKGITPDTLNPSVKGLINRVLVQRLANEDE